MTHSLLEKIKNQATIAWQSIPDFQECLLLDTPEHADNIGSMALLVGMVYAVSEIKKAKVLYAASKTDYSLDKIHSFPKSVPIILRGGNLGNYFWNLRSSEGSKRQYEFIVNTIIKKCHERPVILIPQSFYFNNEEDARAIATTLNAHPNLTLMVRDKHSLSIAQRLFTHCQIILSPDIAFLLYSLISSADKTKKQKILYMKRHDWEDPWQEIIQKIPQECLEISDWTKNRYIKKISFGNTRLQYSMNRMLYRILLGQENIFSMKSIKEKRLFQENIFSFYINRLAMESLNLGIHQLSEHPLVITNRLHGHILSTLIGIPNIILPSPYDKIQNCYDSWTHGIPNCYMVSSPKNFMETISSCYSFKRQG
ncbi:MAG: polysaccharide pyruvyl transferase family protein [Candidatus Brocadiae bacterium]|nr:polysaccharide pyruvyl transferase family protein [Candidatus Brocadiia bacterium]